MLTVLVILLIIILLVILLTGDGIGNRNVNSPEMHSTGKQEENGKCGK